MTEPAITASQGSPWLRVALVMAAVVAFALWWWSDEDVAPPNPNAADALGGDYAAGLAATSSIDLVPQEASREIVGEMIEGMWSLIVTVVDANGDPVAAAAIEVQATAKGAASDAGRTNADGFCRLEVTSDRVFVRAYHSRIGRSLLVAVQDDGYVVQQLRLLLWRPTRVTGIVLGADSRPWPGVHVSLEARHLLYGSSSPHVWPTSVVTNAAGCFEFEAAAAVPGLARLSATGFGNIEADWIANDGAQVVLAVPGALRIEGVVVDQTGNPTLAKVAFVRAGELRTRPQDPQAAERFSLQPKTLGKHTIMATGAGNLRATATVELRADQPRAYVELQLQEPKASSKPEEVASSSFNFSGGISRGFVSRMPKSVVDGPAITLDVFSADGEPAANVEVWKACELGRVMNWGLGEWRGSTGMLRQSKVYDRPMRLLVTNKSGTEHAWLELAEDPVPPRATVRLGRRGSVSVEARCRGRIARGVTLQMWTHHEPFSSGRGKHLLLADEVPAGPALILVRRGFEIVGQKTFIVQPGVLTTEVIEVELK